MKSGMDQCNCCDVKGCRTAAQYRRDGQTDYKVVQMLGTCLRRLKPEMFKRSMLEMSLYRNPQGVYATLKSLKMRINKSGRQWSIESYANKPARKIRKRKFSGKRYSTRKAE
jgi:hypothetical protein